MSRKWDFSPAIGNNLARLKPHFQQLCKALILFNWVPACAGMTNIGFLHSLLGHKGVFATLAERKSRFYLAIPIKHKTAQETNAAILRLLERIKQVVMTLTFDNGDEFSWHSELAKQLECETYFAKPYHSWERGLNAK